MICKICENNSHYVFSKNSTLDQTKKYDFYHCDNCGFTFVANPNTDFENLYNENYYSGLGADKLVNYKYDLEHLEISIKKYEYDGIIEIYKALLKNAQANWLDFGCGTGGLVKYASEQGINIVGYDTGYGAELGRKVGATILAEREREYDFITAIEVLEHNIDPIETLHEIYTMLKPNGIFFLTTGNAQPYANKLDKWGYTSVPDVHISYFEPKTIEIAMQKVGFKTSYLEYQNGYTNIIRNKILKNLYFKNIFWLEKKLPWGLISRVVNNKLGIFKFPIGIK